ncbi:MAG: DNA polymerase III subunit alpha [Actinobacteria bacterium]|nr:DNA polymerase III subunit alpha [Actinomycetota bacterium]
MGGPGRGCGLSGAGAVLPRCRGVCHSGSADQGSVRPVGPGCPVARGSGAGSLVNHILGISAVNPLQHGLLMERFLSPLRTGLPDIDIDVESARRLEVYDLIFARFGKERTACVSMTDTYRVRHAIRDVGRALGLPSVEVAALATSFPHIRARDIRAAVRDLPELRDSSFAQVLRSPQWRMLVECVERLDGLPRHRAMHPCGIILSDTGLLERTAVEPSRQGYPMSQFDKDDVEEMGFLKLDVLGVRMQSALAHAVAEVDRVSSVRLDLERIPHDDRETFDLIGSTRTLGCFQIESPGQRELVGKFSPETFDDLIIDISLFRPGPVKSDMVTPFLDARHGYQLPDYLHASLRPILAQTYGVVAFHEQVIRIIDVMTGCGLAYADEVRRALGSVHGQDSLRQWFYRCSQEREYGLVVIERVWDVLRAFASFGFCKAHAAAFAVPTYQSAWMKRHHPAAFFAGVLTYDPGMYPKRLILDDARHFGVVVLPVDINESDSVYRVAVGPQGNAAIRLPLSEVSGISEGEVQAAIDQRPYHSVLDVVYRSGLSRPVVESLIEIGACDSMHGIGQAGQHGERGEHVMLTRRDLLMEVARHRPSRRPTQRTEVATLFSGSAVEMTTAPRSYGLPEMGEQERVTRELSILSMDVSAHALSAHIPFLRELKATRSSHLLRCRSQQEVVVAGIKVAIQTPPVRSGRRVVFVTLDDGAGPVDITFFEDVQEEFAGTLFTSWLLLVRGHVRRTGARGLSVRATGCWDLLAVESVWRSAGVDAARHLMERHHLAGQDGQGEVVASLDTGHSPSRDMAQGRAASRSVRPVLVHPSGFRQSPYADIRPAGGHPATRRIIGQPGRDGETQ